MNPILKPIPVEIADFWAKELNGIEQRILLACSDQGEPQSCRLLAFKLDFSRSDVESAIGHFQGKGLVEVQPARWTNRYDGSGYLLNERGMAVRRAIINRFQWAQKAVGLQR